MVNMSSFKYFVVTFVVILLNENLFCNGEPGLYLSPPKNSNRCKRDIPSYGHQQVPQAAYHSVQPVRSYGVQQPIAYQLQPTQQGFYAQPTNGYIQSTIRYDQQPQQQVQYIQAKPVQQPQQVQYIQAEPVQQTTRVLYNNQPAQRVNYVQPSTSALKSVKPQKQIINNKNVPTAQIVTANAEPVKYTIPTESQQSYYSQPLTSFTQPQIYSTPQPIFTTYPQGYVQEVSYPQGYPIPETSYPQGYPIQVPETSYPQGYPMPETTYPQGYPMPEVYTQGYRLVGVTNGLPEIVEGPNYIQTSPKYLRQESHYSTYPYGNPNVKIYPRMNTNSVFKLEDTVDTPVGNIDVELIDVMPYKPGTEPIKKIPRVNSIEAVVKPQNASPEDIDEINSIESTTRASLSLFG